EQQLVDAGARATVGGGRAGTGRGPRVPRRRAGRRHVHHARGHLAVRRGPGLLEEARRARLARDDLAEGVRRPRAVGDGALRRHRGVARGRRAGRRALDRRPAVGAQPARLRHGEAAAGDPAAHRGRGVLLRHRDERAGLGLRPRLDPDESHARRGGRLGGRRRQGLDVERAHLPLRDRAGAHLAGGPGEPARRLVAAAGRPVAAGHHDQPDPDPRRRPPLQRGRVRGRRRPRRHAARRGGQRLAPGDRRAGLRAVGPGALPVDISTCRRVRATGGGVRRRGCAGDPGPDLGAAAGAAADVAADRGRARPGRAAEHPGRAGQGRGDDVRGRRGRGDPEGGRRDAVPGLARSAGPGAGRGAAARAGLHTARRDQRDPARNRGTRAGPPV
ncbi:MAG: Acyl-CoA dehydrogenase, long-chain specific, partial [uncultured Blastococcus sp.]